jgi:HEAT repeat protein
MGRKKPSKAAEAARRITGRDEPASPDVDVDGAVARLGGAPRSGASVPEPTRAELEAALSDPDPEARAAAAVALAKGGDAGIFAAIIKNLRHSDSRVVVGAAVALGRVGDPRAVPNLLEAFKTDDVDRASAVAWALGRCGDPAAVPWLLAALGHEVAAASCCEALGHLGDARAAPGLMQALGHAHPDVRAHAARALGRLQLNGDERATRTAGLVISALRGVLDDDARRVRLSAALSLYDLGERAARDEVRAVIEDAQ